jgi:hypothetical protein
MPRRIPFASRDTRKPRGLIDSTQHLRKARCWRADQLLLVLAGAKVAFQDQIETGRQGLARDGKQHCKTRIAEKPRMRRVVRAQHIEQRFLDVILA